VTWKALLTGDKTDLESLSMIFSDGDPKVSVEADGNYFLESAAFDSTDAAADMAEAERVLTMMNGAAKAQDPSQRAVRLAGRFQSEDGRQHVVAGTATLTARTRCSAQATVVGSGGVPIEPPPPPALVWQALASANENVADVLRLLASDDLDWMALYKVVEIIESDVGGGEEAIRRQGWATKAQQKAFGTSANHQEASGDSARHARMLGTPNHTMTLAEGRTFVHGLVQKWLSWRTENP